MNPAESPRRRISLAMRVFLLVAGLLIVAMGTAVFVSYGQGTRIAERSIQRSLDESSAVQSAFAEQRLKELELVTQLIAVDPSFVNYIADAQGGATGDPLLAETASIFDLLSERQEAYGFDLGFVLDAGGNVLARSDQPEAFEESLAGDPFVASAVADLRPLSGFWRMGNALYQATVFPLDQGGDLVGFLIVAKGIDRELSQQIRAVSDADIAFVLPDGDAIVMVGSSLDDASREALMEQLKLDVEGLASAARSGNDVERARLTLGDGHWIARLRPLDREGGAAVGSAIQLTSSDAAVAGYRDILNSVGLTGLIAVLVALPLTLLIVRAGLKPLREMAQAAQQAAAGDYQARFDFGGKDELADLSSAFDSLLSDLRGERDIEAYVTHLSRLIPEPDEPTGEHGGQPSGVAPSRAAMVVVAVDPRHPATTDQGSTADRTLSQAADLWTGISAIAEEHGGRLLTQNGTRALFGFSSDGDQQSPLRFVRELLRAEPAMAASAVQGDVVAGSLHGDQWVIPTALGMTVRQADRLLAEAPDGRLMLSPQLGERAKSILGEGAVSVERGAMSGRPYYALAMTGLAHVEDDESQRPDEVRQITGFRIFQSGQSGHQDGQNLRPGAMLGGRFRIISVLGSGGMGVVYKARDLELEDVVALKMLKGAALRDPEHLDRLKSEIKLARRITHPNVLRTFDFGEFEGMPYISMEYVRGMTLRHLINQGGKVPFTAALRIARQLCAGLQAAHEVGVLHRDIKPENLILEASGNAKLMDFGIARPLRKGEMAHQEEGLYLGTPAYSAPEQLSGGDVDHRADLFASGAMLMEMFCGARPFEGESTVDIYVAQMQGELRRPSEVWPEVPSVLEAAILKCLERDVGNRFQSAAELAAELAKLRA